MLRLYQRTGLDRVVRKLKLPYLAGKGIGDMEPQAPVMESVFSDDTIAEFESPPDGTTIRGRVAVLSGCVQSLAFASVNRATVDVLLHNGWEVVTPHHQPCCGSLHAHNGAPELAKQTAENLMAMFDIESLDAIITNAGGCGSHLKHYATLFPGDARANVWDAKVKDVHEFLVETGFEKPRGKAEARRVTYHESCHLCHGQGVRSQPREILKAIPGLELIELPSSDMCCGSAGIYNVLQPEESERCLERKIESITSTGADCVATSNPGCHLQIERGLGNAQATVEQPVCLLAKAYEDRP